MNVAKILAESVFVRDFHFRVAARDRRIHGRNNAVKMEFDVWPLLIAENYDSNPAPGKILLIADILVRSKQQLITSFLGLTEQVAVLELVPAELPGIRHFVSGKAVGNGIWRAVIEENSHPYAGAFSKL